MSMQSLRFAVVAAAISDDLRHAPALARRMGFRGLLLDAFGTGLDLPSLSISGRRELKHLLSAQEQELVGLRFDVGSNGLGPKADVDRALACMSRVLECAAGLACRLVCVELGPLPEPPRTAATKPTITTQQAGAIIIPTFAAAPAPESTSVESIPAPVDPAFAAQVDAVMVEMGRLADRVGATVAFRSELASFAALHRALQAAACPNFAVDLDPVSILRDRWTMDEIFSTVGGLIRHVRGRDATLGADRRTRPARIGQGSTNWGELLGALDEAGFSGWISVDPVELIDRGASAEAGLAHLQQVSAK